MATYDNKNALCLALYDIWHSMKFGTLLFDTTVICTVWYLTVWGIYYYIWLFTSGSRDSYFNHLFAWSLTLKKIPDCLFRTTIINILYFDAVLNISHSEYLFVVLDHNLITRFYDIWLLGISGCFFATSIVLCLSDYLGAYFSLPPISRDSPENIRSIVFITFIITLFHSEHRLAQPRHLRMS